MIRNIKYWKTYNSTIAEFGARVLSRPDSRGNAREGTIAMVSDLGIVVQYDHHHMVVLDLKGRYNHDFETTLDVILIETK